MNKSDLLKKHREGNYLLNDDFESDLDELLRETAEAQRKADVKVFKKGTDVRLSLIGKAIIMEVNEKPLVTSPTGDKK